MSTLPRSDHRIRFARRDPRVSRRGLAHRLSSPDRAWPPAAKFAGAIIARYMGRRRGAPGVRTVFFQAQPGVSLHRHHHLTRLHLAPRLSLTLLSYTTPTVGNAPVRPASRAHPGTSPREGQPAWELIRRPANTTRLAQVLQRLPPRGEFEPDRALRQARKLAARAERVAMVAPARSATGARTYPTRHPLPEAGPVVVPALRPARPVPRLLRRPAPFPNEGDPAHQAVIEDLLDSPRRSRPPASQAQPVDIEAIDINRLTEKVVQNLDHRITAYRERTGRV